MQVMVDETRAAEVLGISPLTLRRWRAEGLHLPIYRVGGAIRYLEADLAAFLESRRVEPGEPAPGEPN